MKVSKRGEGHVAIFFAATYFPSLAFIFSVLIFLCQISSFFENITCYQHTSNEASIVECVCVFLLVYS